MRADCERAADGRRTDCTLRDRGGDVARPELARGGTEALELLLVEADAHLSVEHSDRRGSRARLAHATLALEPDRDTLAGRKAVRDQRRLECDDRSAFVERRAHLVGELDHRSSSISMNGTSPQRSNVRTCPPVRRNPARS